MLRAARLIRDLAVGYLAILPALAIGLRWGAPPIDGTLTLAVFVAATAHVSLAAVRDAELYRQGLRQVVRSRRTGAYKWSDDGIRLIEHPTREGLVTLTVPGQMWQGLPGRVDVGIGVARYRRLREDLADLGGIAIGAGPVGAASVGAGPVGAGPVGAGPVGAGPVGAGPVGPGGADLMRVTLVGDGFAIGPRDVWEQPLAPGARWQFDVTPLSPIARVLTLVGECVVAVPGAGRRRIPLPNLRQKIAARADYGFWIRWLVREHLRWIAVASVAAAALAAALAIRG
jgi:hypothetical protein